MPDDPPIPAPAPLPRVSKPPRAKPVAQTIAETAVDLVAIGGVVLLALKGLGHADFAYVLIAMLAGVRVAELRNVLGGGNGGSGGPPGAGGITGAVVGLLSAALHRGGGA